MRSGAPDLNHIQQAARELHTAGLCVIPAITGKAPAVKWRQYTAAGGSAERPTLDQLDTWFATGSFDGLGIVCGAASGHLELFEFEGRAVRENIAADYTALANASGLAELWQRVSNGYMELTPSGGIHLLYRVDGADGRNAKLASRPAHDDELNDKEREVLAEKPHTVFVRVLIETRAEGGFVVVAPSGGRTHDTIPDGAWQLLAGGPATIATISPEERDALHQLAGMFDRAPAPAQAPAAATSTLFTQPAPAWDDEDGVSPGDDYNARTTWDELLVPRGWTRIYTDRGGVTYWCRPGKTRGISATTGRNDADNLYVWSSSTEFETERPYDRFGAYAHLEYGGDHSAAAKALQAQGYGVRVEPSMPVSAPQPPSTVGNLAPVLQLHPDGPPPLQVVEERTYAQSDDGNALQLVDRFGEAIRYVPERGRWLAWTGVRWEWQPAGGGLVREYGKRIARGLPEADKPSVGHKKKALSALGTGSMLTQAQTDVRVVVNLDDLDARPWELNTPSGIVDLTSGQLLPSDASRLHTKVTACTPDQAADPSRWLAFLADTFGADEQLVAYLQRLIGYSATGSVAKHVLPFCVGTGGNGKGVFLEALVGVLGDYATTAPSGFLMAKAHAGHETEIARLAGMRMVVCSEVADDDRFDEVKVKQLTGGDTLTARFMRQDHFTFRPSHKLWLMANEQPAVRAGGRAFWRRLRLIPFLHEVPEEKMMDDLQGILAREHGPALLAWIVQGAAAYHQSGLQEPDSVKTATNHYAADQDTVARFVAVRCHQAASDQVQINVTKFREAYDHWCFQEGETPVSPKKLTMELTRRFGVGDTRSSTARFYTRITLLAPEEDDDGSVTGTPDPSQPRFTRPSDDDKIAGPGW